MRNKARHILLLGLAWFFILLGIIGLILPFLQGFVFLAIGLSILTRESPQTKRYLVRLRRRYPKAFASYMKVTHAMQSRLSRFLPKKS